MNVIRAGLLFLFAFSVLAFGAVEVWSGSILEIGASLLFIGWAALVFLDDRIKIYWSPLNWPLLGLFGIGLAQLLLRATPYPFLTRVELLKLAAYLLIFFLSTQVFRERRDLTSLAWFLILLCFSVSLLGIVQHFTSDAKIYGFRTLTAGGDPFGPFVNRNHFAGFVELTLPAGLALLIFRGLRRDMIPLTGLLTIVPVGAMILSGSRGGIVSFAFEVAVLALLARFAKGSGRPAAGGAGDCGIRRLGFGRMAGRRESHRAIFDSASRETSRSRAAAPWFAAQHIFFSIIQSRVRESDRWSPCSRATKLLTTATSWITFTTTTWNCSPKWASSEACAAWRSCGFCFATRAKPSPQNRVIFRAPLHAGAITALCGLLLHSLVDFNLHIPSNALLFLLQAHLATTTPLPSQGAPVRTRKHTRERDAERGLE